MNKMLRDAVVVAYGRSPIGRGRKGSFARLHPVDLAGLTLKGVLDRVPQLSKEDIEDVIVGNAVPEGYQGQNIGRLVALRAGLPDTVPGQTVNRYCSSGLQTIAIAANAIKAGEADVIVAGGIEMMSYDALATEEQNNRWLLEHVPDVYYPMGETAEIVAERYGVMREEMDAFGVESHLRAAAAQEAGKFDEEIIVISAEDMDGTHIECAKDEGIRPGSSVEKMATLKSPFRENGVVTAGTSSQVSDGAAFVVLMSAEKARELGLKPIAKFVSYAVCGVKADEMGIGPAAAIPMVLKRTGLQVEDIDVIELNEAFASQTLYCIKTLGLDMKKVNPNGGAIALGHPLGATGAILSCKVFSELKRTGGKYGMVSMCIGGGMGAAGIWEMV